MAAKQEEGNAGACAGARTAETGNEEGQVMKSMYFSQQVLALLKKNMQMSESTWRKIIAADPTGWRALLEDK
jgi:hypothetical protein